MGRCLTPAKHSQCEGDAGAEVGPALCVLGAKCCFILLNKERCLSRTGAGDIRGGASLLLRHPRLSACAGQKQADHGPDAPLCHFVACLCRLAGRQRVCTVWRAAHGLLLLLSRERVCYC